MVGLISCVHYYGRSLPPYHVSIAFSFYHLYILSLPTTLLTSVNPLSLSQTPLLSSLTPPPSFLTPSLPLIIPKCHHISSFYHHCNKPQIPLHRNLLCHYARPQTTFQPSSHLLQNRFNIWKPFSLAPIVNEPLHPTAQRESHVTDLSYIARSELTFLFFIPKFEVPR